MGDILLTIVIVIMAIAMLNSIYREILRREMNKRGKKIEVGVPPYGPLAGQLDYRTLFPLDIRDFPKEMHSQVKCINRLTYSIWILIMLLIILSILFDIFGILNYE